MNWIELNIYTATEGIDPLCGVLMGLGINGFVIKDADDFEEFLNNKEGNWDYIDDDLMNLKNCETAVTVYLPENSQGADCFSAIKTELKNLKSRDTNNAFGRLEYDLANVSEEDWANNWKKYFKPLRIGKKLLVKPSWEEIAENEDRIILEIDPASSFGTGQHYTTSLCLELLQKVIKGGEKVLDLGCGSGILSIGAILLGADSAVAVDIEQNAAETATENALKNNISKDKYHAHCGNILTDENLLERIESGYDVISANIVSDVLIAMRDIFPKLLADDGVVIISGIITERQGEVTEAVEKAGLKVCESFSDGGWAAILLKKSK